MKVLQIINIGYEAGGAEKLVRILRDSLQLQGHEVLVLATDKNSRGRDLIADAMMPTVNGAPFTRLAKYFWNPAAYRLVRSAVRDFDPDVVHLHTISEFSPAAVWALGSRPAILTVHGPEEFTLKLLPWVLPASDYKGRTYRWEDVRVVGRIRYAYLRYVQRPAYLLALRRLRLVTVPSKFMARAVTRDFPHTPIAVLYSGTQLPSAPAVPSSGKPIVLYVGRLEAVKGVEHLLRAFALAVREFPDCTLRIVGDGPQRADLERLAIELGLDGAVEFSGWLQSADLSHEYVNARVVAIPSVWPENMPLVMLEALAHGRPVIGSRTGGIPELIDPGVTGELVEPGDERRLADAIEAFLADRNKQIVASAAARAKLREFGVDAFIERQIQLYRDVLDNTDAI